MIDFAEAGLDGTWKDSHGLRSRISRDKLYQIETRQVYRLKRISATRICRYVESMVFLGSLQANGTLHWDDGQIWTRAESQEEAYELSDVSRIGSLVSQSSQEVPKSSYEGVQHREVRRMAQNIAQLGKHPSPPEEVPEDKHEEWQTHRVGLREIRDSLQSKRADWALRNSKIIRQLCGDVRWCKQLSAQDARPCAVSSTEILSVARPPPELLFQLRPYQLKGFAWLVDQYLQGVSCILGDEMGLGKTVQTIAFLAHLNFKMHHGGPHLVVCPLSVFPHWISEFQRACPSLRVRQMYQQSSTHMDRLWDELWEDYPHFDVVVTTYDKIAAFADEFRAMRWNVLVLDEGHLAKNEKSERAHAIRRLFFVHSLILTGTPIQCDLHQLWSLLNFLLPEIFKDSRVFDEAFGAHSVMVSEDQQARSEAWDNIHDFMSHCMLRRLKSEVDDNIPSKTETKILCPLSNRQKQIYKVLLEAHSDILEPSTCDAPLREQFHRLQNLLAQLRKVCNHPYIIPNIDPMPGVVNQKFVLASGKFQMMDQLLERLMKAGHRVLIFSQFTTTLDKVQSFLAWRKIRFCRLDGTISSKNRDEAIDAFNAKQSQLKVFLLTTRAGGLGLNLQSADTVIIFDSDWNPQADLQAMARVHRIGQTKPVHVYRLVSAGTVEEKLLLRANKRLFLDGVVLRDKLREQSPEGASKIDEWRSLIKFGADAIVNGEAVRSLSGAELDAIIDRKRDAQTSLGSVLKGGMASSADNFDVDASDFYLDRPAKRCRKAEKGIGESGSGVQGAHVRMLGA